MEECCPEGLNPMLVNEIIKWQYHNNNIVETPYGDPQAADSAHRVIASIQIKRDAYHKITTPSKKAGARYVLFPGCNVYFQPEKILTCLDLMGLITKDYAFVPGLDFCCGDVHICHTVFGSKEDKYNYSVRNYVSLVAEALGIEREDTFKKYKHMKNIDTILEDIDKRIDKSPFARERITKVLNTIFLKDQLKRGEINGAK
jgi:hypothetical protein